MTSITLEKLKQEISIISLLNYFGRSLDRNNMARCVNPAHNDKTPSLRVYKNTNSFCCFGCSAKGSIIDLVIYAENTDAKRAIEFLQRFSGYDWKSDHQVQEISDKINNKEAPLSIDGKEFSDIYKLFINLLPSFGHCQDCRKAYHYLNNDRKIETCFLSNTKLFHPLCETSYNQINNKLKLNVNPERLKRSGLINEKGNLIFFNI